MSHVSERDLERLAESRMEQARAMSRGFRLYFENADVHIPSSGILAGPRRFCRDRDREVLGYEATHARADNWHYPMNPAFLRIGLRGTADLAERNARRVKGEQAVYLHAISETYYAAAEYAGRHAVKACPYGLPGGSGT